MRGATSWAHAPLWCSPISIHAPHARSDMGVLPGNIIETFQSTLLMRGATPCFYGLKSNRRRFQSTLLMRGATRMRRCQMARRCYFNPRSSCEERRGHELKYIAVLEFQSTLLMRGATSARKSASLTTPSFQSTLLMRGATWHFYGIGAVPMHFNPRSSCEERPSRSASAL